MFSQIIGLIGMMLHAWVSICSNLILKAILAFQPGLKRPLGVAQLIVVT